MTDEIAFRYRAGAPGRIGLPARDITAAEFARMPPDQRRALKRLPAYEPVATEAIADPLRSLTNDEYAALTPPEKAARTREAKRRAEGDEAASTTEEGDE